VGLVHQTKNILTLLLSVASVAIMILMIIRNGMPEGLNGGQRI